MTISNDRVYLISGANRGIGLGLATALIDKPNTTVFAGARDPLSAKALIELQSSHPNLHIVKLTSANVQDNVAAVAQIKRITGRLDVVIANAGIAKSQGSIDTTPIEDYREHWEVNTLGPLVLWQAVSQLLLASPTKEPYFGVVSSAVGSIGNYLDFKASAYGSSKAAVNFLVKTLHVEHEAENLVATALHPGWVQTEMGNHGAKLAGLPQAPATMEESITGLLSHIEGATRSAKGGKFLNFSTKSGNMPWDFHTEELAW